MLYFIVLMSSVTTPVTTHTHMHKRQYLHGSQPNDVSAPHWAKDKLRPWQYQQQ